MFERAEGRADPATRDAVVASMEWQAPRVPVREAILFGSRARGTARREDERKQPEAWSNPEVLEDIERTGGSGCSERRWAHETRWGRLHRGDLVDTAGQAAQDALLCVVKTRSAGFRADHASASSARYHQSMVDQALKVKAMRLSAPDRLDLAEALWDSLADDDIPITAAEKALLDTRLAEANAHPDDESSWPEAHARLRQQLRR